MDNLLREIDLDEDVILYKEHIFSRSKLPQYMEFFKELCQNQIIRSRYQEEKWVSYTGVNIRCICFKLDADAYGSHIGKRFGISEKQMSELLRCYALHQVGVYTFSFIAKQIRDIIRFLTSYEGERYPVNEPERDAITEFLFFIGIKQVEMNEILSRCVVRKTKRNAQRTLAHMINYLAVNNELSDLYDADPEEELFLKWFPVFFWAKITFVLPLRATEMLLTPYPCIERRDDKVYLRVRRTKLKKGKRNVHYNIEEDYSICSYEIPDNDTVRRIEKYQKMTEHIKRTELFFNEKNCLNRQLSLFLFNQLLKEFVKTFLVGNPKYEFAKYAAGITEFEMINAGDSRPIAMANLYYQDVGADICRQLADHENISTSAGYYTNVSNTVLASSIMQFQRMLNYKQHESVRNEISSHVAAGSETRFCMSPKQPYVTGDISDCIKENCLQDCLGCRYYCPDEARLEKEKQMQKEQFEEASKKVLLQITKGLDSPEVDFDKLFLDVQTGIVRYKKTCDYAVEEKGKKWLRHKNSRKN